MPNSQNPSKLLVPVMKLTDFRHIVSGVFRRDHRVVNSTPAGRARRAVAAGLVLAVLLGACADDPGDRSAGATDPTRALSGSITVLAAASLTEAFDELGERFEAAPPDATVTFSFGSSTALAQQLVQGAPADVFASADEDAMATVTDAGLEGADPVLFAENSLTILTEAGNPTGIESIDDLSSPDLTVVLCAAQVPCGRYAAQILERAGVTVAPRSLEENVKGVVTKVVAGEADAGIVYVTDAIAAGADADQVPIPRAENAIARYPIVPLARSGDPDLAAAFVDLVESDEGRTVLERFGFLSPS
jgi:molybdate transport system substrate-binding protein